MFRQFILSVLAICSLSLNTVLATDAEIPDYKQALEKMMEKRKAAQAKKTGQGKKSGKPAKKFSKEDRQVMKESAIALAKKLPDPGLKVGQKAPDFVLKNAFGKKVHLYSELKKGPVILTFYRGGWCPFCNLQLALMRKSLPHFKKYNAQLIAVTPQKPDRSRAQVKKAGYPFQVLSDLDSRVMKKYKLYFELNPALVKVYKKHGLDLDAWNGKGRAVLPIPGTLVIDRKGIIRAEFAETDYKKRMEPKAIIEALKKL